MASRAHGHSVVNTVLSFEAHLGGAGRYGAPGGGWHSHVCRWSVVVVALVAMVAVGCLVAHHSALTTASPPATRLRDLMAGDDESVPTLGELDTARWLSLVFIVACLALAAAGGVGGGNLLVKPN